MDSTNKIVIALLGQPNSGKSTLFNVLTGSRQHVGNWPGKTVERKEGYFSHNGINYMICDLPGSYSLSANSDEEIITRDYIAEGKADLVCILADASQLERSLFMLADFAGLNVPAILLLNLMDVAESQGKKINANALEEKLGIPVVPFIAADKKGYDIFYSTVEKAVKNQNTIDTSALENAFENTENIPYTRVKELCKDAATPFRTDFWLTVKCIENDKNVLEYVKSKLDENTYSELESTVKQVQHGSLLTGNCKFDYIHEMTSLSVEGKRQSGILTKFDRLATSRRWGKLIGVGMVLLALIVTMIIASPIMIIGKLTPTILGGPLTSLCESMGASAMITSLVGSLIPNILLFAIAMSGFVLGITFVFSFMEEVGYMARVSFVFDSLMSKLGLQGKAVMSFFMGFGCTVGGAAGTRVIDNLGQRVLAMALVWAVPCATTWSVMPTIATMFFGSGGAMLVMLSIIVFMFVAMAVTALVFGKLLAPRSERVGMIMEMPPYHKPKWKHLIFETLSKAKDIFLRALRVIFIVSLVFWLLSYSDNGDITTSFIYKIGITIEPVTKVFGLSWQTFMAFIASAFSKEAVLGVLSSLYANSGSVFDVTMNGTGAASAQDLSAILPLVISKAEALAFIFATTFNMPCIMALAATYRESHSLKWTVRIAVYYTVLALILSFIVYHIGVLIF